VVLCLPSFALAQHGSPSNAATAAPAVSPPKSEVTDLCTKGKSVSLRFLQGTAADGLARAINAVFDGFFTHVYPATTTPKSENQGTDTSGQDSTQQPSKKRQCLCIEEFDSTRQLKQPTKATLTGLTFKQLLWAIGRLDRPEYLEVNLDEHFLVRFKNIANAAPADLPCPPNAVRDPLSRLMNALRTSVPGLELSGEDVSRDLLVVSPASSDSQPAKGATAAQAARLKHDLLLLDNQYGLDCNEPNDSPLVRQVENAVREIGPQSGTVDDAERELEEWDVLHTVHFDVLVPADVALRLASLFSDRTIIVLAQQHAIVFRPTPVSASTNQGVLSAANEIRRNELYRQNQAEHSWQQSAKPDPSAAKPASPQQPATTTTSTTTITTSAASKSSSSGGRTGSSATAPPQVEVKTTTTTGPATPTAAQSAPSGSTPSAGSAAGNPASSTPPSAPSPTPGGSTGTAGSPTAGGAGTTGAAPPSPPNPCLTPGQSPQAYAPDTVGTLVRLYHFRHASNIAAALNTLAGTNNPPLVQALCDYNNPVTTTGGTVIPSANNDDLLLILPPMTGQPDRTNSIRRMIADLDERRPDLSLQVWSYEISTDAPRKPQDRRVSQDDARRVSDAYIQFKRKVEDTDDKTRSALESGLAAALDMARRAEIHGTQFFDSDAHDYLTQKFQSCIRSDQYCLGYDGALTIGPERSELGAASKSFVSLERFILLLAAVRDDRVQEMVNASLDSMDETACKSARQETDQARLCFKELRRALLEIAQPRNLRQFRVALLDFLFQYKLSNVYPTSFAPYWLQHSAQALDSLLNLLVTALDRDLDRYIEQTLSKAANDATRAQGRRVGVANNGEVQVRTISGDQVYLGANVSNYFDITKPALLSDVLSNWAAASTSSTTSNLFNTLNPTQGLALSALATLASPPQLVANINAQTTLMVTPISLDTASSAELNINLALSEPSSAISALGGPATSSFVRQDLANTVANANVQTTVQVDSMKLFQVSSLSMDITHAQSAVPVPVVGWVYDSIFGTVPWMNDHLLAIQRQPKTIQNRAVVVVRAVVVPTAMDLGLSIPFRSEQISDPITSSSLRLSTLSETDNKWTEFHQQLMNCILRGENQCMTKIRLSKILDQE
jgi:hypothetical protein